MSRVDEKRLIGNFGAAYVTARISSHCLVRPVAADTDVGIDLYCETVQQQEPFLHFWLQVKAGQSRISVSADKATASYRFKAEHLAYWQRQPVPVYAALVPIDWPVTKDPAIYVVDITGNIIEHGVPKPKSYRSIESQWKWGRNHRTSVDKFLRLVVPEGTAKIHCTQGVVARIPSRTASYVHGIPEIPVEAYWQQILTQIRTTAAWSIILAYLRKAVSPDTDSFRRRLANALEGLGDKSHWETLVARGLSSHLDGGYSEAQPLYSKALRRLKNDERFRAEHQAEWRTAVSFAKTLLSYADKKMLPDV